MKDPNLVPVKTSSRAIYVGMFKAWALGVATVISGLFFGFNSGFMAGFGSFIIISMLMGTAYVCFACSMAEVISGLPFAGGAYGLARMSLGFYPGFLIGCLEAIEYIFFASAIFTSFSQMLATSYEIDPSMVPVISLVGYVVASGIHLMGPKAFWTYTCSVAVLTVILLLIYCFGCLKFVNFTENSPYTDDKATSGIDQYFVGGGEQYMRSFFVSAWLYVGVEATGFMNDSVEEPTKSIPKGYVASMVTLFLLSIFMLFVLGSLPPNVATITGELLPLNPGYELLFGIPAKYATIFSLPATFTAGFEFIFPYSRLLVALASSNLFPTFLKKSTADGVHYAAIIFGSLLSYSACVLYYYYPDLLGYTFSICTLSTFLIYISQLIGYIRFVTVYSNMSREFHSPVGLPGAVYALCIYATGALSILVFEETHYSIMAIAVLLFVETVYYYVAVKDYQVFSEEETRVMYLCHMINFHLQEKHELDPSGRVPLPRNSEELQSMKSSRAYEINQSKVSCVSYQSPRLSVRGGGKTPMNYDPPTQHNTEEIVHKFAYDDTLPQIVELTEIV